MNWMLRIWLDWYWRKVSLDRVNEILESGENRPAFCRRMDRWRSWSSSMWTFPMGNPVLRDVSFTVRR